MQFLARTQVSNVPFPKFRGCDLVEYRAVIVALFEPLLLRQRKKRNRHSRDEDDRFARVRSSGAIAVFIPQTERFHHAVRFTLRLLIGFGESLDSRENSEREIDAA